MELQHVNVKIYVDGDLQIDPERFIEVFHRWVAEQSTDELLIDVADYRHVPAGPGVVMVGHKADYAMDNAGSRFGLLYNRKAPLEGSNECRLHQALKSAADTCRLLEAEFDREGPLKFNRHEFAIIINDRALAPNTDDTYNSCKTEIESFLTTTLGHEQFSLELQSDDPRCRFTVIVKLVRPLDFAGL